MRGQLGGLVTSMAQILRSLPRVPLVDDFIDEKTGKLNRNRSNIGSGGISPSLEILTLQVRKRFGVNFTASSTLSLYQQGLATVSSSSSREGSDDSHHHFVDPLKMTAVAALEMIRFMTHYFPAMALMHEALRSPAWPCALRLCLSHFTASSGAYDRTIHAILTAAGVASSSSSHRSPQHQAAMEALRSQDLHRHPSRHATASILPADARGQLQATVKALDVLYLEGFFHDYQGEKVGGYGTGCASH